MTDQFPVPMAAAAATTRRRGTTGMRIDPALGSLPIPAPVVVYVRPSYDAVLSSRSASVTPAVQASARVANQLDSGAPSTVTPQRSFAIETRTSCVPTSNVTGGADWGTRLALR